MTPHGNVGPVTWRKLLWHYDYPSFKTASVRLQRRQREGELGDGRGDRPARSGRRGLPQDRARSGAIGDVSREHGGNIAGCTRRHEVGLDVDVRPIRDNENQCTWGTNWRFASYDRGATRALIKAIRAAAPGHVKLIYFNDPVLISGGPDDVVRRPRRPPARPLLREVVPDRRLPLLRAYGSAIDSVMSLVDRPGVRPPRTT